MPWTVDDPPAVARNWTRAERERCVSAANQALEDGKTEEEAIIACIGAAGKSRPTGAIERKQFPAFVTKVDTDQGIVESIVSVFGNIDEGGDIIHPGAFRKTISERLRKIRVLDQHNTDSVLRVVGKPLELREIGREELPADLLERFPDATGGLFARTQFLLDTPEGEGVFKRIKAGAVDEWSIGFDVLDQDFSKVRRDGKDLVVRNLRTIRLWEYSPVVWGMNPATATLDAKRKEATVAQKEMTADGPVQRMGDVLAGTLRHHVNMLLDSWLIDGMISRDEHALLSERSREAVDSIVQAMPGDFLDREMPPPFFDFFFFSGRGPDEAKVLAPLLDAAKQRRALSILDELRDLIGAGTLEGDADEGTHADDDEHKAASDEGAPDAKAGDTKAGPAEPPTSDDDLLRKLDLERFAIDLQLTQE